jgi:hypothetical protein
MKKRRPGRRLFYLCLMLPQWFSELGAWSNPSSKLHKAKFLIEGDRALLCIRDACMVTEWLC